MAGFGTDRLARRMLGEAQALSVPDIANADAPPPSPVDFAAACGLVADPWQAGVLSSTERKLLLNCCRQSGKSTTTAVRALYEAAYREGSLTLLLSPSQRQSGELFRKVTQLYKECTMSLPAITAESALRLELDNGSRVIALPGSEATTRGYSAATLVIIDEASRVLDALIAAVRPSLATTDGQLIALSTPAGRRGFFFLQWSTGDGWQRTEVKAQDCKRISKAFLDDQRQEMGEFVFAAEYLCEFQDVESAVFASELIARALENDIKPLWWSEPAA